MPDGDDFDLWLERIQQLTMEIDEARNSLSTKESELGAMMEGLYV